MEDIRRFERENTVPAEKQVTGSIIRSAGEGRPRILFIGNSITLHGIDHDIGWHGLWGMAASEREKDYVHQTMRMVRKIAPSAEYMIAQGAEWEVEFWQQEEKLQYLHAAAEYDADIIVVNLGENVSVHELGRCSLTEAFVRLIGFFNPTGRAKGVLVDDFWPSPEKDECIHAAAQAADAKLVKIGHLGVRDDMKAIGLFEHSGVAAHPGDLGMLRIAEKIFSAIEPMIKEERK